MISLLSLTIAAALTQGEAEPPVPGPIRRRIEARSRDAWTVVLARLEQLGLAVDEHDRKNQALRTKWLPVSKAGWLPALELPPPYVGERIRFIVFVSPFVEPARISVGSEMLVSSVHERRRKATVFNDDDANRALMSELEQALAAAALPRLAADPNATCASPRDGNKRVPHTRDVTPPRKIALSAIDPPYPGPAIAAKRAGSVVVELQVAVDGSVRQMKLVGPRLGDQLEAAAMGAASLLLHEPPRVDGCPVPWILKFTVNFNLRDQ
jgi:TonB family protein